jgi:hypothetical protein
MLSKMLHVVHLWGQTLLDVQDDIYPWQIITASLVILKYPAQAFATVQIHCTRAPVASSLSLAVCGGRSVQALAVEFSLNKTQYRVSNHNT